MEITKKDKPYMVVFITQAKNRLNSQVESTIKYNIGRDMFYLDTGK